MEYTKLTYTAYKQTGKFLELRSYSCKIETFETSKLLTYLYKKHPKLKNLNFSFEAWKDGQFNGRLIINSKE